MVPELCKNLPITSILQGSVLNVTNLCDYEVQQLQQFAAHTASQSCHRPNSIDVVPLELAYVLVILVTVALLLAPQGVYEICRNVQQLFLLCLQQCELLVMRKLFTRISSGCGLHKVSLTCRGRLSMILDVTSIICDKCYNISV